MRIGDESARELEASLIQHVRTHVGASRSELARRMELSPSTVGQYVDRLVSRGLLQEGQKFHPASGRPATRLNLNPSAGHFVGVDFEARQIWVTVVDFAQTCLAKMKAPIVLSDTAEDVIAKIVQLISRAMEGQGPLLGIGVGAPGVVDVSRGVGLHYQFISGWKDVPLQQRLSDIFAVPVALENNIRAMALAEALFGQGRGVQDFICLGIRSGIAAGVFVDGHLHSGPNNLAGEIGSWPCDRGATLEQLASFSALAEVLEEAVRTGEPTSLKLRRNSVQVEDVLEALRQGDHLVLDVFWRAGQVVGKVVAQMNLLLNPSQIIITGPLAGFESQFIAAIRETVEPLVQPMHSSMPLVVGSQLGEFAGALGGAALAVRRWSPTR